MRGDAAAAYRFIAALVDALAAGGVRDACLAPGSRSAPLALAFDAHGAVKVWPHLDERSAAFFALGLARARRAPVALVATSGTATANFLPAVVEARLLRVPLIVLTADRPPELRDAGAPQTIDQAALYGRYPKWSHELAIPGQGDAAAGYAWSVAARAALAARTAPAGPVHLNVPLREPLVPGPDALPVVEGAPPRALAIPGPRPAEPSAVEALAADVAVVERGLIVAGPQDDGALPAAVSRLARATGYPVLADPLSLVRFGPHDRGLVVDAYDAFLREETLAADLGPDLVLRLGDTPTSQALQQYLARCGARQVLLPGDAVWNDPDLVAREVLAGDLRSACDALADAAERRSARGPGAWAERWRAADERSRQALAGWLGALEEPFEGRAIAELAGLLPDGATLFAGNSMPVRDLDAFARGSSRALRPIANRGANGIDGVVSTALGASAGSAAPLALAVGDVSFVHDLGGLLAARAHGLRATILLLNNDGGGIFSFLPVAEHRERFERLFGTPHGLDLSAVRGLFGVGFERPDAPRAVGPSLAAALASDGVNVVEVRTDRERNVALHREAHAAVARALAAVPA